MFEVKEVLEFIRKILSEFGWKDGLLIIGVLCVLFDNRSKHKQLIEAKDEEIKRLVEDNKIYRHVYLTKEKKLSEKEYKKLIPPDDGLSKKR